MFDDPRFNLHIDLGCAAGDFLFDLALINKNWNYLGIEIHERLINTAKLKVQEEKLKIYILYMVMPTIFSMIPKVTLIKNAQSISFYFPDPWFKKRHHKGRIIQPGLINILSILMQKGSLIFIKTDVKDLFNISITRYQVMLILKK